MKFFWGILFSGAGILILGTNLGWWNADIWSSIWLLWPLIIIAVGLRFMVEDNRIFMILALLLVLVAGYTAIQKPAVVFDKIDGKQEVFSESINQEYKGKLNKFDFKTDVGASRVNFSALDENENSNLYKVETTNLGKITNNFTMLNDSAKANVVEELHRQWFSKKITERRLDVKLNKEVPLSLDLNSGASSLDLNLKDLRLERLDLNAGASNGDITLGEKSDNLDVRIEAGASKILFYLPKNSGVKINFDSEAGLNTKNFDSDFDFQKTENNLYTSKNYKDAAKKINIKLSTGVSSIEIKAY